MVQVTAGEASQVVCRRLAKSRSPVDRWIGKGGSGKVWYNLNTLESIAERVTSLVLLRQRTQLRTYAGKMISWRIREKEFARVREHLEQVLRLDTCMEPQDPDVTGRLLVDRMDNSTHLYKITHGQLWVAHHTIIRGIDMVRVSQCTLQSVVLDDWRYNAPLVLGLAGTRYGGGLKGTVHG